MMPMKASALNDCALNFQLDLPCVTGLVAGLAERNQVVERIVAGLTAFEVVHVEEHVPKAEQIALLIVRAFNSRIFDLLNVERCRLNHDHD